LGSDARAGAVRLAASLARNPQGCQGRRLRAQFTFPVTAAYSAVRAFEACSARLVA